ncbi:hypothetical protein OIO90_004835 [Microbotryomycetes sp. JL221]|nr:hypothetical protein OIO90_004835 [Microbotryomycetes sp. JL221]
MSSRSDSLTSMKMLAFFLGFIQLVSFVSATNNNEFAHVRRQSVVCTGDQHLYKGKCVTTCPAQHSPRKSDGPDGNMCVKVLRCNQPQYFDINTEKCITCTNKWSYAATCDASGPKTCKAPRVLTETEDGVICGCDSSRFLNASGGCSYCSSYFARSATCTKDGVLTCLPTFELKSGRCNCPTGTFMDTENNVSVCKPCDAKFANSKSCTKDRISVCQSSFTLSSDKQSCGCAANKIMSNGSCQYCSAVHKYSLECNETEPTKCRATLSLIPSPSDPSKKICGCDKAGEALRSINGIVKCASCADAFPGSLTCATNTVKTCGPNFTPSQDKKTCVCPADGYELSQDGQTCAPKSTSNCQDPFVPSSDGTRCICKPGTFRDTISTCEPCYEGTLTCDFNGALTCDEANGYTLQNDEGKYCSRPMTRECPAPLISDQWGWQCVCPQGYGKKTNNGVVTCEKCTDPNAVRCFESNMWCKPTFYSPTNTDKCEPCNLPNALQCRALSNGQISASRCEEGYATSNIATDGTYQYVCKLCPEGVATCEVDDEYEGGVFVRTCKDGWHLERTAIYNTCVKDSPATEGLCWNRLIPSQVEPGTCTCDRRLFVKDNMCASCKTIDQWAWICDGGKISKCEGGKVPTEDGQACVWP